MDSKNDWYYNKRGQYRSIAFGTWKAGAARRLNLRTDEVILREKNNFSVNNYRLSKLNRESRRMGESSPNLCRLHPTHTQRSLGAVPSSLSVSQRFVDPLDCYSSSEYVEYIEGQKGSVEAAPDQQAIDTLKAAFRLDHNLNYSLSNKRKSRLESSLQRAHHRSQSAGADTHNAVVDCDASTSTMKNSLNRTDGNNTKFLRATKKFFRKIYNSTTLPTNRKQAESCDDVSRSRYNTSNISCGGPVLMYNDEDYCSNIEDDFISTTPKSSLQETTTDSGLDMDRSSTPDHSLESITLTSKSDISDSRSIEHDNSSCKQENWNNLFEQLRREMNDMRIRDAQILADLHRVEWHLKSVKQAHDSTDNLYPVQSFQI